MPFAGSVAPEGYLLCDGSAVSRTTYATLFEVIGTTYGAGDGSTTFNVPDLTGRVVIGVSGTHALASTGGSETVTLTTSELPAHSHEVPQHGHGNDIVATTPELSHTITQPVFKYNKPTGGGQASTTEIQTVSVYSGTNNASGSRSANVAISDHAETACTKSGAITNCAAFNMENTGGGTPHSNMQPYIVTNYIICTGEV